MECDWILVKEIVVGHDVSYTRCKLCSSSLSAPFYTRKEEEDEGRTRQVYVHKACGDLPEEMEHKLKHPGHTLLRHEQATPIRLLLDGSWTHSLRCDCCDRDGIIYYKCSDCQEFVLCIRCALKCFPITHPCHPQHPLIPIHDSYQDYSSCVVCRRKRYGAITYKCTTCPSFQVHQECVSSWTLKLPFHRHDLKLIHSLHLPAENHAIDLLVYCHTCGQDMKQGEEDYAYHCPICRYFFHTYNCRPIEHVSHSHELNLVNYGINADHPPSEDCNVCGMKISVPYYYCNRKSKDCRSIFLHKYCAHLPQDVEHRLHPSHALTLSRTAKNSMCDACHAPCEGLSYSCAHDESCCFSLDTLCAMKTLPLKHEFHQHPLFSSPMKALTACHACNLDSEGASYQCTICRFWVHQDCASLPMSKKTYLHPHWLNLNYSLRDSFPENRMQFRCHVCRQEIKRHNWVYHCAGCKYFIHAHNCSDPNRDIGEEFDLDVALAGAVYLPVPNESVSLATLCFMGINHEEDKEVETEPRDANGIRTRSRKIPFLDPNETCDLCEGFLASPCNNCAQCKYFLLKSSSELKDPYLFEGFYSMLKDKEEHSCNGFGMSFLEDGFINIKISCSVLPRYVKHEGHSHVLSTTYKMKASWCDACEKDFKGYGFRCNFCNFTIDTYCALLPGSVSHKYDKEHGFKLTYYSIEDVEEYVCELCEEDITTMWFYHCEECDHSIHPRCIWKIHIMFGPFLRQYGRVTRVVAEKEFPLVRATKSLPIECLFCGEKEISGCRFFLDYDGVFGGKIAHLDCFSRHRKVKLRRWHKEQAKLHKEQAKLRRKLAMLRSQEDLSKSPN